MTARQDLLHILLACKEVIFSSKLIDALSTMLERPHLTQSRLLNKKNNILISDWLEEMLGTKKILLVPVCENKSDSVLLILFIENPNLDIIGQLIQRSTHTRLFFIIERFVSFDINVPDSYSKTLHWNLNRESGFEEFHPKKHSDFYLQEITGKKKYKDDSDPFTEYYSIFT